MTEVGPSRKSAAKVAMVHSCTRIMYVAARKSADTSPASATPCRRYGSSSRVMSSSTCGRNRDFHASSQQVKP